MPRRREEVLLLLKDVHGGEAGECVEEGAGGDNSSARQPH